MAKKLPVIERHISGLLRVNALLSNPEKYVGQVEEVGGWIKKIRPQKTLVFIDLNDGSSVDSLQVIVDEKSAGFEKIKSQSLVACVKVKGKLVKPEGRTQAIEMIIDGSNDHSVEVLGTNEDPGKYPMGGVGLPVEHLRKFMHLRPRTNLISAMARVRSQLAMATHQFFQENGFYYIHTPIITASDCEGAGEMFQVTTMIKKDDLKSIPVLEKEKEKIDYSKDFFGREASLTVSGQLAVENYATALTNVYTFGPTFRAEKTKTVRHLNEFWMIEPEMCFAGLEEVLNCIESYIKYCINYALLNFPEELKFFNEKYKRELKEAEKEAEAAEKAAKKPKKEKKEKPEKTEKKEGKTENPEECAEAKKECAEAKKECAEAKEECAEEKKECAEEKKECAEAKKECAEAKCEKKETNPETESNETKATAPKEAKAPKAPKEPKEPKEKKAPAPAPPKLSSNFSDLIEYLQKIVDSKFARLTYTEAVEYLMEVEKSGEHKFEESPYWGLDLSSEHERYICEKKVNGPVFLYNYPEEFKAFYMRINEDGKTVQNADLLLPFIGEVVGGSVREERLDKLTEAYKRKGLHAQDYEYYTDLRRYGSVPHGGFGVGFERLIMLITGIKNIREAIPYPREIGVCDC